MIHEIGPKKYNVTYQDLTPTPDDMVIAFEGNKIYFREEGDECILPKVGELTEGLTEQEKTQVKFRYLFSIDDDRFFMSDVHNTIPLTVPVIYEAQDQNLWRTLKPRYLGFAGVTAFQLNNWYKSHKYCGGCGVETEHSAVERAVVCPQCKLLNYPRISPVTIVGIIDGERLLVTRYHGRPAGTYSLVAGFVEIGETFEDSVMREVFEETGVRVKNLRYYKSQPWGFSSSLIGGFFCDLDGDPTIVRDDSELVEALWIARDELPPPSNTTSITAEMIEAFRTGLIR